MPLSLRASAERFRARVFLALLLPSRDPHLRLVEQRHERGGVQALRLFAMPVELGIIVRVSPADVDPGQQPGTRDDQRPEHDAQGEAGGELGGQQRFVVRDQEDESEIQGDQDAGEGQRQTALPLRDRAEAVATRSHA